MSTVEITFERGLRIWWSYTWRTVVLLLPVIFLVVMLFPETAMNGGVDGESGTRGDPMAEPQGNFLLMLMVLVLNVVLQVQALRWMLQTKWREFRLQAVPVDAQRLPAGHEPQS